MGKLVDVDEVSKYVIIGNGDLRKIPPVEAIPKDQYIARLKADMVAMLEDLKQDIIAEAYGVETDCSDYVVNVADIDMVIQQKIDVLKADKERNEKKHKSYSFS